MKLFKVDAPSIHTSLKLILADKKKQKKKNKKKKKNKDYLISYNVICN